MPYADISGNIFVSGSFTVPANLTLDPGVTIRFASSTRLVVASGNTQGNLIAQGTAAEVERQAEAGKLSLADLNNLAGKGKEIATGVLALVFGTANPQDVALALLSNLWIELPDDMSQVVRTPPRPAS